MKEREGVGDVKGVGVRVDWLLGWLGGVVWIGESEWWGGWGGLQAEG